MGAPAKPPKPTKAMSFKPQKNANMGGIGAQSYSHIPTLDRQESSKKESVGDADSQQDDANEMLDLPVLDVDSSA